MLTKKIVKDVCASDRPQKLFDEKGLYLYISKSGGKSWRFDYRFGDKRFTLTFGLYPDVSLDEARKKHLEARGKIANDTDPALEKKLKRIEQGVALRDSFDNVAKAWYASKEERRSKVWKKTHQLYLDRDLLPKIGNLPLSSVTTEVLLAVLEQVEKRSGVKTADRVRQTCVQVFDFGMRKHKVTANVARALVGWAEIPAKKNRAWLKESELPKFLDALETYPCFPTTKYAVRLLLHTFVRKAELLGARWDELDLNNAIWVVPAERMKMLTDKKTDRHNAHDVPLSRQALLLLKQLKPICAGSDYLFPGNSSLEKPLSHSTLNVAFNRLGYAGLLTPHGIRATASTILNERGFRGDLIERQLAHVESNMTRAAYNHAKYLAERREMMQAWSDILDEIQNSSAARESIK